MRVRRRFGARSQWVNRRFRQIIVPGIIKKAPPAVRTSCTTCLYYLTAGVRACKCAKTPVDTEDRTFEERSAQAQRSKQRKALFSKCLMDIKKSLSQDAIQLVIILIKRILDAMERYLRRGERPTNNN